MYHKKVPTSSTVIALLTIVLGIALTQLWGTPLDGVVVGLTVYALYGFLVASYLLRLALIFLGVFAIYKILLERSQKQMAM